MDVRIVGRDAPGSCWTDPRAGGATYENVVVGIQRRSEVIDRFPADVRTATWDLTVDVIEKDGAVDLRGPHVHGKRGDRFLYLSWGEVVEDEFRMFRRAKLMLAGVGDEVLRTADRDGRRLVGTLALTGGDGGPRCAAVRPPGIDWTVESARGRRRS